MKQSGVIIIAGVLAGSMAVALYAGAGSEAAAFLKIDSGARAAAMGGAYTAVGDDASSVFYNPAGAAFAVKNELMLSHGEWLAGLKHEHAAYLRPVSSRLTLFTGLTALIVPSLDKLDANGDKIGSFSAMDGAAGAGLALALAGDLFGGLSAKTVYQQADGRKALAYALDLGLIKTYGDTVRLGLAAQNIGTSLKLYSGSFSLPRTYRGGAAYRVRGIAWLTAEGVKAGESDIVFAAGAEGEYPFSLKEKVFARLGCRVGSSRNAGAVISAGAGLRSNDLRIDYAFSPIGDLGDTHRISLTIEFGRDRDSVGLDRKVKSSYSGGKTPARTQKRALPDKGRKPAAPVKRKKPASSGSEDNQINFVW